MYSKQKAQAGSPPQDERAISLLEHTPHHPRSGLDKKSTKLDTYINTGFGRGFVGPYVRTVSKSKKPQLLLYMSLYMSSP